MAERHEHHDATQATGASRAISAAGAPAGRTPEGGVPRGGQAWPGQAGGASALSLLLVLLALTLLLVIVRHNPPDPAPASSLASEYSGERARQVLSQLVGDGQPHPAGSAADDRVRQQILAILTQNGYQPHVEEGFACHPTGACAHVRNVVARLDGREPGSAVALAAHYDSVGAGPGASDDLAGVAAILEIARALKATAPPRHSILMLLDEGEETGLLGAAVFEDSGPEHDDVKAVVNLEARGANGPSYMFETSGENAWLIDSWAPHAERPVTTSLAAFLYTLLPNDTDLTVFRQHRVAGLNFAFIGGAPFYHTPYDNLANSSPASLQHQGANAMAAITGLAGADIDHPRRGNLVFFDVLSMGVVRWPVGWCLWMAVLALVVLIGTIVAAVRARALSGSDLVLGLLVVPVTLLVTTLAAFGISLGLGATGAFAAVLWLAHPLPALAAFWLLGLAVVAALAIALGRRGEPLGLWAGVWTWWALLALVLSVVAPATSYLFALPALIAAVCGAAFGIWRVQPAGAEPTPPGVALAVIVPSVVAALLWFSVLPAIYAGIGVPVLPVISALVAIALTTAAPLITAGGTLGRRLWQPALALTLVAVVVALPQPRYSPSSPQRTTLVFFQDADAAKARWVVGSQGPVPAAVLQAASFGKPGPAFPWSQASALTRCADAPSLAAATGPELQLLGSSVVDGKRHVKLRLISHRDARSITLWVPAAARVSSVAIDGHEVPASGSKSAPSFNAGDWRSFSDVTLAPAGCQVEVVLDDLATHDWYVVDSTPGLPAGGAALIAARPPSAVPMQNGDVTLVAHKAAI